MTGYFAVFNNFSSENWVFNGVGAGSTNITLVPAGTTPIPSGAVVALEVDITTIPTITVTNGVNVYTLLTPPLRSSAVQQSGYDAEPGPSISVLIYDNLNTISSMLTATNSNGSGPILAISFDKKMTYLWAEGKTPVLTPFSTWCTLPSGSGSNGSLNPMVYTNIWLISLIIFIVIGSIFGVYFYIRKKKKNI